MKNLLRDLFYILVLMAACISLDAQTLNKEATKLKETNIEVYDNIKKLVSNDWEGDHQMMVYTINLQAKAVFEVLAILKMKSLDVDIMVTAMKDWTNKQGLVDYQMVAYQYNLQYKAKGNY